MDVVMLGMDGCEACRRLKDDQKIHLELIYGASRQMLLLVNGLLDIARIEKGRLKLDRRLGDIGALVSSREVLLTLMARRKRGANSHLNRSLDPVGV